MGNHVEMVWETPLTDLGSPDSVKYSDKIYLFLGGTGQLQVDLIFDGKKKTFIIDCPDRPRIVKRRMKHKGRRFKLRLSNIDGSELTIKNVILMYSVLED